MEHSFSVKHKKFRVDGSEIVDTRNKWQKIVDEKYGMRKGEWS